MNTKRSIAAIAALLLALSVSTAPMAYAAGGCGIGACHCTSCTYEYSNYVPYNSELHTMAVSCSVCGVYATFGGSESHTFSGNTCISCGYTKACSHSSTEKTWETSCKWVEICSICGETVNSGITHGPYTYGPWSYYSATQHRRPFICSHGDSGMWYETAGHSAEMTYTQYSATQHAVSSYCSVCSSAVGPTSYADHTDGDGNGYCDACGYLMTRFSVSVPASLSMTVSQHGEVYAATGAAIVNHSTGAVRVTALTVTAENGWRLVPYDTEMAAAKVDAKQIGFALNGAQTTARGTAEQLTLDGGWTIAQGGSLALQYGAVVSAMSVPVNEQALTLVFVLDWDG